MADFECDLQTSKTCIPDVGRTSEVRKYYNSAVRLPIERLETQTLKVDSHLLESPQLLHELIAYIPEGMDPSQWLFSHQV